MSTQRQSDPIATVWRAVSNHADYGIGLRYLLHEGQCELRDAWAEYPGRRFVVCCSRRYGKSYWLCVEAVEQCIKQAGSIVLIAAPTAKMVRTIVEPHMRKVLDDCPPEIKPAYSRQEGVWRFRNGSELRAAGCDNQGHERLRGAECHLALVDEAGFIDDLDYVIQDVLLPQTLTTDGRILMASTPPNTPAHPFQAYCLSAEAAGTYVHRTIYDAPHISPELITEYIEESGGEEHSTWRREYMAEFVVDETRAVLPEFQRMAPDIVGEVDRPDYFHTYISMDVGYHDLTVALLAYYHFDLAKLVIEEELVFQRATSDTISNAVEARAKALWAFRNPPVDHDMSRPRWEPVTRVVDAPEIVVADLRKLHAAPWRVARKDDKDAALNALRLAVSSKALSINPRCRTLIAHCKGAIWNKARTSFERVENDRERHHFDAVDALVYMWRHVDRNRNPYPTLRRGESHQSHFIPRHVQEQTHKAQVRKLFRRGGTK